jgi:hypothetical protein
VACGFLRQSERYGNVATTTASAVVTSDDCLWSSMLESGQLKNESTKSARGMSL